MDTTSHHDASSGLTFSVISLILLAVVTLAYWIAASRQRQLKKEWRHWRSLSFSVGAGLLALAVLPATMDYAHRDLRGHMVQHLLIGMLAPLGLVLSAPVSLLLRSVSTSTARLLTRFLHSAPVRVMSFPVTAMLLNVGGMYVLYLTPLYVATLNHEFLHYWLHVHFLLAGYLFTWSILAGPDPGLKAPSMSFRLGVLLVSIAAHAVLAKLMYGYGWPRNTHHSLEEIQGAAQLMYYGGDAAELLLIIALFVMWYRKSQASPT